jgi:hypothetical protein
MGAFSGRIRQVTVWTSYLTMTIAGIIFQCKTVLPYSGMVRYESSLSPSLWTFHLWNVMYFVHMAFTVFQTKNSDEEELDYTCIYLSAAYLLSASFLILIGFGYEWASFAVVLTCVAVLFHLYRAMQIGQRNDVPPSIKVFEHMPVSMHLAWAILSSLMQLGQVMEASGWTISRDFSIGVILVSAALSVYMGLSRADLIFAIVTVWGYLGIAMSQSDSVSVAAFVSIGLTLVAVMIGLAYERYFQEYDAVGRRIPLVQKDTILTYPTYSYSYKSVLHPTYRSTN